MKQATKERQAMAGCLAASGFTFQQISRAIGLGATSRARALVVRQRVVLRFKLPDGIRNDREFARLLQCDPLSIALTPNGPLSKDIYPVDWDPKRRQLSDGEAYRVLERDKFRCVYCNERVHWLDGNRKGDPLRFTIDHEVPRSCGGATVVDNCVTSCQSCNSQKSGHVSA